MDAQRYELGERVEAVLGAGGSPRPGVVIARLGGVVSRYIWENEERYMVRFDGERGTSGPCVVIRAERAREDVQAREGTGS